MRARDLLNSRGGAWQSLGRGSDTGEGAQVSLHGGLSEGHKFRMGERGAGASALSSASPPACMAG